METDPTSDQEGPEQLAPCGGLSSADLLAACERRAIELYYAAPPEKLAGECRAELVSEFGEDVVKEMLRNGIGNNCAANSGGVSRPDER